MRRRQFISLLGGAASWPLAAGAQQAAKVPTIGFLGANAAPAQTQLTEAFLRRLRELGWAEGRNIAIEYRWAEGRPDRAPASSPNWSASRLMSSSPMPVRMSLRRSKQRRTFPSSLPQPATRSASVMLPVWRGQAGILP